MRVRIPLQAVAVASILLLGTNLTAHASYKTCVAANGTKTFTDADCPPGTEPQLAPAANSAATNPQPRTLEQQRAEVIRSWDQQIAAKVKSGEVPLAATSPGQPVKLPPLLSRPEPIPRSMPGDKGQYHLLGIQNTGPTILALHQRTGSSGTGFTLTETNCKTWLMVEHGYTEGLPEQMTSSPTKWFSLVPGSSKSDLAKFLCSHYQR